MKKYRLKINYSEITEENIMKANALREVLLDGQVCKHEGDSFYRFDLTGACYNLGDIPKSWLTEIKEALSFEEWYRIDSVNENPISREEFVNREKIWNAAIENYKLGQDVDEVKDDEMLQQILKNFEFRTEATAYTKSEWVWNAALKYARGEE